ncbi:nuclear transport factor 2 family protein [Allonocardiopsis opalescens]|uniref:SnoaL-like domain-containing protein n=1 Tax=Allonocardiopsis opalescens TaxID=1144618 RepID=A0A2T0Q5G4_9ACTN|nr:nuclear transport factor 2 family protein [Allonocardiopsis opalescens]PRX99036.1 hypothetical protein CLV72_104616 [Allonocardiopsis opalescens]
MSAPTETTTPREMFDRLVELFLAKDLTGFAELFAEDGVLELPFAPPGRPSVVRGRAAIRAELAAIAETPLVHREFRDMAVYRTDDPEVVIAEYDAHGEVAGTGRGYVLRYVQVLRVREGRIAHWRDYFNPLAGAELLGGSAA